MILVHTIESSEQTKRAHRILNNIAFIGYEGDSLFNVVVVCFVRAVNVVMCTRPHITHTKKTTLEQACAIWLKHFVWNVHTAVINNENVNGKKVKCIVHAWKCIHTGSYYYPYDRRYLCTHTQNTSSSQVFRLGLWWATYLLFFGRFWFENGLFGLHVDTQFTLMKIQLRVCFILCKEKDMS